MNSLWKISLLVVLLVVFLCVGIGNVINPDWFIRRSGVRKGGKLLTDWNRWEFQIAGAVFAGLAAYLLYVVLRS